MKTILLSVLALLMLLPTSAFAEVDADAVVHFELALAGYRLGMSYDEASAVRPFYRLQDKSALFESGVHTSGFVDGVVIDDVEMNIEVAFSDDQVVKILARFHPAKLEGMLRRFESAMGKAEDNSRTVAKKNGEESRQTIFRWRFPGAEALLVGVPSNSEYAFAALISKKADREKDAEPELH